MLCENCKKNAATFHFTQIINNEISEIHLCSKCSAEKGLGGVFTIPHFNANDSFTGLTPSFQKPREVTMSNVEYCPLCGLTYHQFKETGRLGCSQCYSTFRRHLRSLLKKIHGSTQHAGKIMDKLIKEEKTQKVDSHQKLLQLREKLQIAVSEEDYEQAAKIRDQIKEIERQLVKK